ncbi:hypothetical protein B5D80_19650 [Micromonospora wenchangensis]|uniref:Uncharacterized protein n=1 Tax=Micromonospora wenchangensis TaxID=1185415 RepID=A0A246RIZ9_9ACTN|nr:hypothetical protein [Micromonospora wenchangensis]OWV04709.1 hypothetical protein B5D80_19650 [Micromonospora wenchangensis]
MLTIELGNDDRLYIEPDRTLLSLYPAVAGAHLSMRCQVSRQADAPDASPFQVSGLLYVCRRPGQELRLLGPLHGSHPISPAVRSGAFEMAGFVSDEQLRVIEELRRGDELWFHIAITVASVEGLTPKLMMRHGSGSFHVGAGEWSTQVQRVDAGAFIEVLVPMVAGADYSLAWQDLREARTLLHNNEIKPALIAARRALELVRKSEKTLATVKAVRRREAADPTPRVEEKRTVAERFAFIAEALFAAQSGAAHRGELGRQFEYSRAEATALIAGTAGMLARLAEQRRRA